jgi:4-hydroxy-tetrahydrodipicolinate synthase
MTESFMGTGVALVTPFKPDKSVDFEAIDRVVNYVINGGVEYIVVLGTTGEVATLTKEEKKLVVKQVIQSIHNKVPVVIGIGGNNTADVVESIKNADLSGISAILSVSPYYNKPTQQGLYEHFSAIAAASPLPIIIYNVPSRTASNISAETTLRLANDHNNIIATKEASGNFSQLMQIIKYKPANFQVISGDDILTLPMLCIGGTGVISVVANAYPKQYSDMVRAALKADLKTANRLHYLLTDFINALFEEGSPAGVKAALEVMKICGKEVRLPLVSASEGLMKKIGKMVTEIG